MEDVLQRIKESTAKVMVGKEDVVDFVLTAIVAGGHVLLEDMPGTGKTVLAKTLAKSMDLPFGRVQFTPDLLPSDVTGLSYFDPAKSEFVFREGPVFTGFLLADEINRATPRTQSSLLECMSEGQVTVDGVTRMLDTPFFVMATQNPIETLGCFPLPEAQLDRFLMKIKMGGLSVEQELGMVDRFIANQPMESITPVCSREDLLALMKKREEIFVHPDLKKYVVELIQSTRKSGKALEGVSPRGTLAMIKAVQGYAMVQGRSYVVPEDVKALAVCVLAHRYQSQTMTEQDKESKIHSLLSSVAVPTENWEGA